MKPRHHHGVKECSVSITRLEVLEKQLNAEEQAQDQVTYAHPVGMEINRDGSQTAYLEEWSLFWDPDLDD